MRITFVRLALFGLIAMLTAISPTTYAQNFVTFNVPGPATWNDSGNWNPAVIPEAQFNDIGVINNGRFAYVDDAPAQPGGIVVSLGKLEIRSGGNLTTGTNLSAPGNLVIGQAGRGELFVHHGGTLDVKNISMEGFSTSYMALGATGGAGTATLNVTGGTLNRITQIIGPNVDFSSSGNLTFGNLGTLIPVITGSTHSAIDVTGLATLDGRVRPEFEGYTPTFGQSWQIVNAGSFAGRFADVSGAPNLPRGAGFVASANGLLTYTNKLILVANRATGAVTVQNVIGDPVEFDAYTISSPSGRLTGPWTSLQNQLGSGWDEADNSSATRLTELNPTGSSTLNVGQSYNLGNALQLPTPTAFGQSLDDLTFSYSRNGQDSIPGFVEYVGGRNNVVLTIDPNSGEAQIQNESPFFNVSIDGYTITSTRGALQTGNSNWSSLQDQGLAGWDEADNSSTTRVTELKTSGATLMAGGGTTLNLGNLVNVDAFPLLAGEITFSVNVVGNAAGDYNANGVVDAADYVLWRNNLGSPTALPNDDTPGVGADDLTRWRANFGNTGVTGGTYQGIVAFADLSGSASGTTIPEPSTVVLCVLAVLALTGIGCRPGKDRGIARRT
jgi:hypothetical protein